MPILAILGMQIRDDETLETVLNQPDWVHRLELFGQRILISGPNDQLIPHKAIKDKFNARKKPAHVALYTWTDGRIL
jgi:tRNA(Ser,Leu) C12 N-acetylase TAN1